MRRLVFLLVLVLVSPCFGQDPLADFRADRFSSYSLQNPYGAGSRYRAYGLLNPYGPYGSPYSNRSWRNPYATRPPRIYSGGHYLGEFSTNPYRWDSIANPYGRFGNPYAQRGTYLNRPVWIYPR